MSQVFSPGGFERGTEGKIEAIKYIRKTKYTFLKFVMVCKWLL